MAGCGPTSLVGMNLQGCKQLCQTRDVLTELFDL